MRDHQPIAVETLLSHVALFGGLAPTKLAKLAKGTREQRYGKDNIVFQQGDICTGLHVMVFGQVKLSVSSAQGVEKVVDVVQQGQCLDKASIFVDKPYPVSAQTLGNCTLLHISKSVIFDELADDHELVRRVMAGIARRTHELMLDMESNSLLSGRQRIINYLMSELDESRHGDENVVIELRVRKGVIASRLNLTQEHFSRILHELSELGLIKVDGTRIIIPNVECLNKHKTE